MSHQPSLCYTISETVDGGHHETAGFQVTSAPNLLNNASSIIDQQTKAQMEELPNSNRVEGTPLYDAHSYLTNDHMQLAQTSQSSVPTEDVVNQTNAASRELAYLKKYKKAKKQLKLLLRDKRDSENRTCHILNENSLL